MYIVKIIERRDMANHKLRVTSYELRVESLTVRVEIQKCVFRSTSYEFESTSYEFESTSSRIITSYSLIITSQSLLVQEFKIQLDSLKSSSFPKSKSPKRRDLNSPQKSHPPPPLPSRLVYFRGICFFLW